MQEKGAEEDLRPNWSHDQGQAPRSVPLDAEIDPGGGESSSM